ncbi:MAG: hypothetical protein QM535_13395 [Limnohabitans sp.]|nr:hypothetical protein [Limnohabitans sp.]
MKQTINYTLMLTLALLIAVGEEVKKIDSVILKTQSSIPWQKVAVGGNFNRHTVNNDT